FLKLFLIAAFTLVMGVERSSASHGAGGNLTYTHLQGNQYLVHFTYYRDCFGIPAPTSVIVYIESNACGIAMQQFNAPEIGVGVEITYPCSTSQTTCNNGQAPGIQRHDYEVTIALPGQCPDWRIWVTDCCRNAAITTLNGAAGLGVYIEARLNNSVTDNSSPQFAIDPILFVCTGANFAFNNGAIDQEGDSLVYSFIAPRTDANTNCAYNPGYSVLNPISSSPSVAIDPVTGDVSMFPTSIEVGVMVVLIYEYRNGDLIGSVMRDIQIYTVACSNTAPSVGGIDNTGNFTIASCAGATICFDVPSSDPDAGDTLTMTYNGVGIPNATWSTTGVQFPTGHFCWTTTAADARTAPYTFFITIRDNNCPSNGVQIYSFNITVGGGLTATFATIPVLCNGDANGSAVATVTGGSAGPFDYLWSDGQTTQMATNLGAGPITVQITDPNGCQATQSVTITEPTPVVTNISNIVDASCGTLGSFDITASGGTPGYSYYTNTVPPSITSSVTAGSGTYLVTVQDANLCQSTANVTINGGGSIQATETHTDVSCNGANDGTATVNLTGGNGTEIYTWTPNVSTTSSASGLAADTYTVNISNGACSTQVVIVISEPTAVAATEVHSDVTCNNAADGSISLSASGGSGVYSYAWTPNVSTGASASALGGGNYSIVITDDNQCSTTVNVTIAEATAIVLSTSTAPASCLLTNGSATVVASGGAGGYSYSWSNGGTTSTISNIGTGTYTVDVMDANGCIANASAQVSSTGVSAVVSSQTDATCEGGDDGSATVTASGGQAPYTYGWSPIGDSAATAIGLAPGVYVVTVTDYLGCSVIVNVTIGFINPAPSVDLGPDSAACIGTVVTLDAGAGMTSYLWSDNSMNQTLDVGAAGAYGVVVTDANGCQNSDLINVTFVQCLIARVNHFATEFSVFPNPTLDFVNVAISNIKNENVKIEMSDVLGNKVYSATEKSAIGYKSSINISNLPVGIYMLRVQYLNEVKTIKVVKN
ncbi:MAG: T9SS type A sorting domain-containing protein, partial [Bacteroidota bacterium]